MSSTDLPETYTPEEVAQILKLSKNTVYELINRGEVIAKKYGRVYRIPKTSISFVFSGLDEDIKSMQKEDERRLKKVKGALKQTRKNVWEATKYF